MDNNSNINDTACWPECRRVNGTEMMVHYPASARLTSSMPKRVFARTRWPSLKREDDRHRWEYETGVWFNSIIFCSMTWKTVSCVVWKFLDAWDKVTASTDAPVLRDEWNDWRLSPADNLPGSTSARYFLNE